MSPKQQQMSQWIMARNYAALNKGTKGNQSTLHNIVVELKKCCNHPYLVDDSELVSAKNRDAILNLLISNSGKLVLLDKLLERLKKDGHRVLIFSQMVRMLDLLAEYLRLRGYTFQRLDGSVSSDQRRQAMDHFNAEGSNDFCFLLSTRAGGLGINLATADTVILYDSDWNPQNDLQAQARAHRIGQKNAVNIYRFVTTDSVEEHIIESAKRKMVLDHLVIQRMDTSGNSKVDKGSENRLNKEELQRVLAFSAQALFKASEEATSNGSSGNGDGGDASAAAGTTEGASSQAAPELDLDEILARAETHEGDPEQEGEASELLNAFKVAATFEWDKIIPKEQRDKVEQEEQDEKMQNVYQVLSEPRKRKTVEKYSGADDLDLAPTKKSKEKKSKEKEIKEKPEKVKKVEPLTSDRIIRRIVMAVRKYGWTEALREKVILDASLETRDQDEVNALIDEIVNTCHKAVETASKAAAPSSSSSDKKVVKEKDTTVMIYNVSVSATSLVTRLAELALLAKKLNGVPFASFRVPGAVKAVSGWNVPWGPKEDGMLLVGVNKYGFGSWNAIFDDEELGLKGKLFPTTNAAAAQAAQAAPSSATATEGGDAAADVKEEPPASEASDASAATAAPVAEKLPQARHVVKRAEDLLKALRRDRSIRLTFQGEKVGGSAAGGAAPSSSSSAAASSSSHIAEAEWDAEPPLSDSERALAGDDLKSVTSDFAQLSDAKLVGETLLKIGACVTSAAKGDDAWTRRLWMYVAEHKDNTTAAKLARIYARLRKTKQTTLSHFKKGGAADGDDSMLSAEDDAATATPAKKKAKKSVPETPRSAGKTAAAKSAKAKTPSSPSKVKTPSSPSKAKTPSKRAAGDAEASPATKRIKQDKASGKAAISSYFKKESAAATTTTPAAEATAATP